MPESKPYAPAADRNGQAILKALQKIISPDERVFEFGSGTGQHACRFAQELPDMLWQPSDLADKLSGIRQWIIESGCSNILPPVKLDLASCGEPAFNASVCFSANTLHIISWHQVEELFRCSSAILVENGMLIVYGPFKVNAQHTSDGNRLFDERLRESNPHSGIRDIHDLDTLATRHGFSKATVIDLPANNKLLWWRRVPGCVAHAS